MPQKIEIVLSAEGSQAVAQVFKDLADKGNAFANNLVTGGKRSQDALTSLGRTAKDVFAIFTGFTLGNIAIQIAQLTSDSIRELTKMGLENQRVEESFKRMASAVGVSADQLVASLKRASDGIVDTNAIMLSSSKALAQGLNADQLGRVMETARAQATLAGKTVAESYNAIAESVTNLNVRQLREFGIVIDLQKEYERYAASLGTTAAALNEIGQRAAIMNAIDEQTRRNRLALTQGEITNAQEIEKARAKWSDFFSTQAKGMADAYTAFVKSGAAFITWAERQGAWLDKLAQQWDQYKANTLWGAGTAFPNAGSTGVSAADLKALAESDAGMFAGIDPTKTASAADGIDKVKDALIKVDAAMQRLALSSAQENIRAAEFAGAIGGQIAQLQALGSTAPEVQTKIMALQIQMAGLQKAARDAAKAVEDAIIAASTGEVVQGAQGVEDSLFAEQTAAAAASDQFRVLQRSLAVFGDTQASLSAIIATATAQINALPTGFEATDKVVIDLTDKILAAKVALAEFGKEAALVASTAMDLKDAAALPEVDTLTKDLLAASRALGALKAPTDLESESLRRFGVSFDLLDDAAKRSLVSLKTVQDQAGDQTFSNSLQAINVQAQLFGVRFDDVAARVSAFQSRLTDLASTSNGTVTPAMQALAAQLEELRKFQDLRDTFGDIFSSVGNAFDTLVQGVILGTQTMAQAFKKLGQAILLDFANVLLQKAFKPIKDELADILARVISGSNAPASGSAASAAGGMNTAGALPGEVGGAPLGTLGSIVGSVPTSVLNPTFLQTFGAAISSGYQVFQQTGSITQGLSSLFATFGEAQQAISGFTSVLGYAAAALQAAFIIFDQQKSDLGKAIQTATLAAGVGLSWATSGISLIVAPIINWIEDMFGLFGKQASHYDLARIDASNQANQALGTVGGGYQSALRSGDIAQILTALQGGAGGGSGNSVRTELVLPTGLANQIGLTGQQIGDQLVTQWKDVTLDQFKQVIQAFKESPDLIQGIRGSGDVPLLEQGDAAAVADQIKHAAQALLTAFEAMESVRDRISTLGADLIKASAKILPPGLAEKFAGAIVNPIKDRMLAVLSSGLGADEMQAQLDALSKELQSFAGLVALYGQLDQDIAQLSGDLATQTRGAVLGITTILDAANKAVSDAQGTAASAVGPEAQLTAEATLRDAILKRYATEMQLIQGIEAAEANILQTIGKPASDNQIAASVTLLSQGVVEPFNNLRMALAGTALYANTVVERLFGINQGLALVIAGATAMTRYAASTDDVLRMISAQAAPFLGALGDLLAQARGAGDLQGQVALLQQQAEAIKAIGAAAVQAVQDWANAAISVAQATRDATVKAAQDAHDATVKAAQDAHDAQVGTLKDQITAAKVAGQASQDLFRSQIDSARKAEDLSRSISGYLAQLQTGNQSPLNPADQLKVAKDAFAWSPIENLQQNAQNLLATAQNVYTRPDPRYQAIYNQVVQRLGSVSVSPPVSAADLEAQMAADAANTQTVIDQLQAQIDAADTDLQTLIAAADANLNTQIDDADANLVAQIDAINAAAKATIDGINAGVARDLLNNATAQLAIQKQLLDAQEAQRVAITGGLSDQAYQSAKAKETVDLLTTIRDNTGAFLTGIPQHAEGSLYTRAGLAVLHPGEIVIPKRPSDLIRQGGWPTASPTRQAGVTITYAPVINASGSDPAMVRAVVREQLRQSQRDFFLELQSGTAGKKLRGDL